ncbi:MAG: hypothetical protein K9W44_05510 [Candidatus Lokiarchaeota archaeon]|nr:hypothetical protein [Candidatus Harpocratesius repetitus]
MVDQNAKIRKKIVYNAPNTPYIYLNDNELLKIRMGHSDKQFVLTILPNYQFYSYKKEVREKRITIQLITGVIIGKEEDTAIHREALKMCMEQFVDKYSEDEDVLKPLMQEAFSKYFDQPELILDKQEVEARLSNRIKELNRQGKFDEAAKLLDKIKKIPKKLYRAHDLAENALKRKDFEKAQKEYENAKNYAKELNEDELVKMYSSKIAFVKRIPALLKKREELVEKAMKGLRTDNFKKAQINFMKAAEVSEELMDARRAEEYALKARALAEYVNVDRQFSS